MKYSQPKQCKECLHQHGQPIEVDIKAHCVVCGNPANYAMGEFIFICSPCGHKWDEYVKPAKLINLHWRQQKIMWKHYFIKFLRNNFKKLNENPELLTPNR